MKTAHARKTAVAQQEWRANLTGTQEPASHYYAQTNALQEHTLAHQARYMNAKTETETAAQNKSTKHSAGGEDAKTDNPHALQVHLSS